MLCFLNVYQRVCRKDDEPWDFGGNRGKLWDRPNCIQTNGLCENETPVERWFDDILWMVELKSAMIRSHASHPLKSNFPFMVDRLSGGQADRWDYSWDWSGGGSCDVLFLEWEPGLGIVFICSCRGCCSSIIPHTDIMLMIHSSLHFLDPDVFSSSLSLSLTLTIYIYNYIYIYLYLYLYTQSMLGSWIPLLWWIVDLEIVQYLSGHWNKEMHNYPHHQTFLGVKTKVLGLWPTLT
jgi:hypothetical protein